MDIPRKTAARNRLIRRIIYVTVVLIAVPLISLGIKRLQPAAPPVDGSTVWPDTVKRGPMLRQVRGLGTLVAEDVMWIPAMTQGRVEKVLVRPGTAVKADTIIMELSNPEVENAALAAEYDWKQAEANYTDLNVRLESQRLTDEANVAKVESDYRLAKLRADTDEQLAKEGLTPELTLKLSRGAADELDNRQKLERKRVEMIAGSIKAQLDAQKVKVGQARALYGLRKSQMEALKVRAGTEGVLAQLGANPTTPLEAGQQFAPGAILAKVAQPWKLKAELKVQETQAKDITFGQKAEIDTRNGIIPGRVSRIDPTAQNGTVTVDVKLEGKLPPGARPDLSVDGTIELERLDNVLYVGRPVFGQQDSLVTLFKIDPDGKGATRAQVKFGRASVNTIEILEGLKVGDRVILSDMQAWDAHDRIRLNPGVAGT